MRICVVRLGGMGDILLATPAVRALSERFDTEAIDFIVGPGMAPALEGTRYIRKVLTFDRRTDGRLRGLLGYGLGLRMARYDLFVNFHPSAKTLALQRLSGAKKAIVFRKDRRVQPDTGKVRHAIDDFTKELAQVGIDRIVDRRMDFFVPDAARESVRQHLLSGPYVAVNPAGTREINRWPPDRFGAFLDRLALARPDLTRILIGGPGDRPLANAVLAAAHSPLLDLTGRLSVKELGALLEGAATVVTGDTGPLHIAAAVGAPIVCLSGAADPNRTGPSNNARDLVVIRRDLPCVPCQDRTCRRGDIACMTGMEVDWVLDATLRRLEKR